MRSSLDDIMKNLIVIGIFAIGVAMLLYAHHAVYGPTPPQPKQLDPFVLYTVQKVLREPPDPPGVQISVLCIEGQKYIYIQDSRSGSIVYKFDAHGYPESCSNEMEVPK